MKKMLHSILCAAIAVTTRAGVAQQPPTVPAASLGWAETVANHYSISPDVTYGTFNNIPVHLDVWKNTEAKTPAPTLMYIHGGGWVIGDKTGADTLILPYLQLGWNVVNVEYRMAGASLAPAAVQDARCALRWIERNASTYNIDTTRIVASGHSAGGHLALMMGMLPEDTDLDSACPGSEPMKIAAVVNWYGITDVKDILDGPDKQTYAAMWIGVQPFKDELATHLSPLTYIRPDLPPIITIHGDHDPTVAYSQAVRLRDALTKAGDKNELVTIPHGVHGSFSDDATLDAYTHIWDFLRTNVPSLKGALPTR